MSRQSSPRTPLIEKPALQEGHQEMHRDHCEWQSETALWHDELRAWQGELRDILSGADVVHGGVQKHLEALQSHAAFIRLYEQQMNTHEHCLAQFEQGEAPDQLVDFARKHRQEADHHANQRTAHQRVRKHQQKVMTRWRSFLKVLTESV